MNEHPAEAEIVDALRRRRRSGRRRWPAVLLAVVLFLGVGVTGWLCIDSTRFV